jgi:hypothetical protein
MTHATAGRPNISVRFSEHLSCAGSPLFQGIPQAGIDSLAKRQESVGNTIRT